MIHLIASHASLFHLLLTVVGALAAGLAYEPQNVLDVHNVVYGTNKQTTFGTPIAGASYTQRPLLENAFAVIHPTYYTDLNKGNRGHQWATVRRRIKDESSFQATADLDNVLAGWLFAFSMGADTVTGLGPFTHVFKFLQSSNQMPVTSVYFEDTADVLYQMPDLAIGKLQISGSEAGPLQAQFSMVGSGSWTDGAVTKPGFAAPALLYGSDTDVLLGPQGAAVSIKERVRSWAVSVDVGLAPHYAPGGGLKASFMKVDTQRATVQLTVAAKDVDDIRGLINGDTIQELDINTNSGAQAQLNLKFPGLYLKGQLGVGQNNEEEWNLEATEQEVVKSGANEVFQATVINGTATYLTGA